jgi:Ca2+-binding EF-hand superfamily protein
MYQGLMDIQEGFFKVTQRLADLNKESESLQIELLKAQGRTQEANSALRTLATEGMTQTELAVYDYNDLLKQQIEALKKAETVTNQRISLEQRLFQLGNDVVALRAIELNKLDETNRGLQLQIWVLEDYNKVLASSSAAIEKASQSAKAAEDAAQAVQNRATDQYVAATEKVAAAQKSIADLAIEAAKRMQGFGKSLRDFVKSQLMPESNAQNASQAFAQNTRLALTGDVSAIEKVPELAQAAIDAAKASARSSEEFNSTRAAILAGVTNVAKFAEAQASLTNIPADEDPLVVANRALEDAIREQTKALSVANTIGASLVKAPEDLIAEYKKANQDLATAIVEKALAKEAQTRAQAALDTIAGNTGNLITAITGSSTETAALGKIVETEFKNGFSTLDTNLDGKLTFDELKIGLAGKATNDQIKDLIKAADINRDDLIDVYELELFNSTKSIVEALGSGFQMLDTNLDGKVSEAEFIKGMTGKASDAALKTIFDLVDADNNKIITATELTAAQSALTAVNSANLTDIKDGVAGQVIAVDTAATSTANAITSLNNENLLTITNNTATTVQAINLLLNNNVALFNAMNAVAANTKSLADSVTAGSGQAASGSAGSGNFLSSIGRTVGGVVSGVIGAVGSVVSSVGKAIKKLFSDERTKKNISLHTRLSNGIGIYDYNYKEPYAGIYGSDRKRGVLAQEVKEDYPNAVSVARNGMYMVDYSKLPVPPEMLKFARGGVFSNQVVTRPTSFSLAQMGEAGPEAIMPLSRTSNGRLGVVAQTQPDNAFNAQIQNQNTALIEEVRKLREEVNLLRFEARATASATGKTTRILERVTQNGDSLLVTDAATV